MLQKHFWAIFAGGWALTTPIVILVAWLLEASFENFKVTSVEAEGIVIGHQETTTKGNGKRSTTGWDDYEYTTATGRRISFSIVNTGSAPKQPIGHRAPILYQPDKPEAVRLNDGSHERGIRWVYWLSPIGVVVASIVTAIRLRARRSHAQHTLHAI